MMLIDLILAVIFIIIITALICMACDGAVTESALIGIVILLLTFLKIDTIQVVNTTPIISIIISALIISMVAILASMFIHKANV